MKRISRYFSFLNSQFSTRKGFTLIELLTVIGILGVIGSIVVSIVVITLRGTTKTNTIENARQNGGLALTQMVKTIRYAQSLDSPVSCVPETTTQSITVTSLTDNAQTTLSCDNNTLSSNSASLIDTNSISVASCSFICRQQTVNDPPSITIEFSLSPATASNFIENNFSIPFQSSVTMRNYSR